MFVLLPPGNEVAGAALATTVSNSLSLLFFILSCANEMSLWDLADFRINSNCGFLRTDRRRAAGILFGSFGHAVKLFSQLHAFKIRQ